ncbi:MAG: single-stranded DNA-binding protein [Antricoccus sp.]
MTPTSTNAKSKRTSAQEENSVVLIGRLSGTPEVRELPSGDQLTSWRLVVRRPAGTRAGAPSARSIDTVDCSSLSKAIIGRSARWPDGTWLHVEGSLRRRFWQTPTGPRSRYDVEVATARITSAPTDTLNPDR